MLLSAAVWQAGVSDWYDRIDSEYQYWIQEEVNIAILNNQKSLASLAVSQGDEKLRRALWEEVADRTGAASGTAIERRDARLKLQKNEAKVLKGIRFWIAIFGTFFIIIGKYMILRHKACAATK